MKRGFKLLLAVSFAMALTSWGQTPDDTGTTATPQVGPTPQYTHPDQLPSLNFLGEAVASSTLTLGVRGGYNYQSYQTAGYSGLNRIFIGGNAGIISIHPKWDFTFSYSGSMNIEPQQTDYNYFGQNAGVDILYQLSPHWQIHASDRYLYTSDPFESYFIYSGPPLPNQPNPVFYYPTLQTQQNTGTLELADQLTRVDSITLTGGIGSNHYGNYSPSLVTGSLYNVQSYSGGANYTHQFSPRLTLGGGYSFTSLDFSHGFQRTGISQIQFIADYKLSPSILISGYVGPEYVSAKDTINFFGFLFTVHQSSWTPAFGANFSWRGLRNSLTAGFARQTSSGGGLLATTYINSVRAAYTRQLTAKWTATVSGQYGNNQSFTTNQSQLPNRGYTTAGFLVAASRRISQSMGLSLNYGFVHQSYTNIYALGTSTFNYSAAGISLDYNWKHPLGR